MGGGTQGCAQRAVLHADALGVHAICDKCQVSGDRIENTVPASILSRVTCHASLFYSLVLLFFALGLMCKPMLVTLPLVLLLLDYWPLDRFS